MSIGGGGPSGDHGSIGGGGWGGDGQGSGPGTGSRGGGGDNNSQKQNQHKKTVDAYQQLAQTMTQAGIKNIGGTFGTGIGDQMDRNWFEKLLGIKPELKVNGPIGYKKGYKVNSYWDPTDSPLLGLALGAVNPLLGGLYSMQRHVRKGNPVSAGLSGLAGLTPAGSVLNVADGLNSATDFISDKNVDDLANLSIGDGNAPNDLGKANEDGGNYFTQNRQTQQVAQAQPQQTAAEKKQDLVEALMGRPGYTYSGRGIIHTS